MKKTKPLYYPHILHVQISRPDPVTPVVSLASDEFKFSYPLRRYKALKEEKANSKPLTVDQVKRFLTVVDTKWRDYFVLRFWTGMRSCEVHALKWEQINFAHRLIRVRYNYVNGELCDVKTPKSRRDLKMCDTLFEALTRLHSDECGDDDFVFTHKGLPLDTHWVSKKLWYPTLNKAGLAKRRAYETRHTAAVLHIAALENPLYISQMLGHSDTRLLFDVYAPYVANASQRDGASFDKLMNKMIP
ncbi:tyrosine-type recombinase/integrase [Vibrio sp. B1Z05]|nr:tyrosine-type recombinase/integrase [Vibrio sp. B1Z05]